MNRCLLLVAWLFQEGSFIFFEALGQRGEALVDCWPIRRSTERLGLDAGGWSVVRAHCSRSSVQRQRSKSNARLRTQSIWHLKPTAISPSIDTAPPMARPTNGACKNSKKNWAWAFLHRVFFCFPLRSLQGRWCYCCLTGWSPSGQLQELLPLRAFQGFFHWRRFSSSVSHSVGRVFIHSFSLSACQRSFGFPPQSPIWVKMFFINWCLGFAPQSPIWVGRLFINWYLISWFSSSVSLSRLGGFSPSYEGCISLTSTLQDFSALCSLSDSWWCLGTLRASTSPLEYFNHKILLHTDW